MPLAPKLNRPPDAPTPELAARIIGLVRDGVFLSEAAEAAGISRHTATEWRRRGEDRDNRANAPIYREFARSTAPFDWTQGV